MVKFPEVKKGKLDGYILSNFHLSAQMIYPRD